MPEPNPLLRHMLAIIAYRGGKVLRDAPDGFGSTRIRPDTRSAVEILAHINDVLEWGLTGVEGKQIWNPQPPRSWEHEVDRFYDDLKRFDEALASCTDLPCAAERLLAGPLADPLTHIGQLSTLRKLAGAPVKGESYYAANVETGRVGRDQPAPVRESD